MQKTAEMLRRSALDILGRSLDIICLGLVLSLFLSPLLIICNQEAIFFLLYWKLTTALLLFRPYAVSNPVELFSFFSWLLALTSFLTLFPYARNWLLWRMVARALAACKRLFDVLTAPGKRFFRRRFRSLIALPVNPVGIVVLFVGATTIAAMSTLLQLAHSFSFALVGAATLLLLIARESVLALRDQEPILTRWAKTKTGWLAVMMLTPLGMGFAGWSAVNFEAGRLITRMTSPVSAVTHGVDIEGRDVAVAADFGGALVFARTNVLQRLELGDDRPITKLIWSPSPLLQSKSEFETSEAYSSRNAASLEERQQHLNAALGEPPLFRPEEDRIVLSAYQARVLLKEVRPYKAVLGSARLLQIGGSATVGRMEVGPELDLEILSKIEIAYSENIPSADGRAPNVIPSPQNTATLIEWLASVQAGVYPLDPTDPYLTELALRDPSRIAQPGAIAVREGEVLWWDGDEDLGPVVIWQGRGTPIVHLRPSGRVDILGEVAIEDISAFIDVVLSARDPFPWTIKTIDLLSGAAIFTLLGPNVPTNGAVPTSLLGAEDIDYIVGLSDGALLLLDAEDAALGENRAARFAAPLVDGTSRAIFVARSATRFSAASDTAVVTISRRVQNEIITIHADDTASRFEITLPEPSDPSRLGRNSEPRPQGLELAGTLEAAFARQLSRHPFPYELDGTRLVVTRAADANDLARKVKISGFSDVPAEIARLNDGRLIIGAWDGQVRMIDLELAERLNDLGPDQHLATLSTGFARASDQVLGWILPSAVSWATKTRLALANIEPAERALAGTGSSNRAAFLSPLPAFAAGSLIAKPLLSAPEPLSSGPGADDPSQRTPVSRSIFADQIDANEILLVSMTQRGLGGMVSLSRQGHMVIQFGQDLGPEGDSQIFGGLPSSQGFSALDCSPSPFSENAEAATLCLIQDIRASGQFEYAEPDWIFEVQSGPARAARSSELKRRPLLGWQWALTGTSRASSSFEHSWTANTEGEAITVAVIDTGIDWQNPLMDAPFLRPGWDMVSDPLSSNDGDGRDNDPNDPGEVCESSASPGDARYHGTQLVSVIAGVGQGGAMAAAANNVDIVPVRAFGNCGGRLSDINDAIRWSAGLIPAEAANDTEVWNENPAGIILLAAAAVIPCPASLQEAINAAANKGSVIVVAAGNAGRDASNYAPANCENVVTAAASDALGRIAPYSNFGPSVSLLAPGGDLARDDNQDGLPDGILAATRAANCKDPVTGRSFGACNLGLYEGTSFAAAHTAAALALLKSQSPLLSSAELKSRLLETATQRVSEDQCPLGCGAGRLDLSK